MAERRWSTALGDEATALGDEATELGGEAVEAGGDEAGGSRDRLAGQPPSRASLPTADEARGDNSRASVVPEMGPLGPPGRMGLV